MSDAIISIRAHFDGKVIVPEEPMDLPVNTALNVEVRPCLISAPVDQATIARRLAGLERFVVGGATGASISAEALRREGLYGDAWR
jgi:hypothetical protein